MIMVSRWKPWNSAQTPYLIGLCHTFLEICTYSFLLNICLFNLLICQSRLGSVDNAVMLWRAIAQFRRRLSQFIGPKTAIAKFSPLLEADTRLSLPCRNAT